MSSRGRSPFYVSGVENPLVTDSFSGVGGNDYRMVWVPEEVAPLVRPAAEALSRIQGSDLVKVSHWKESRDVEINGVRLTDLTRFEISTGDEALTIDYLHTLITAVEAYGRSRLEGANQKKATRSALEFLAGLH